MNSWTYISKNDQECKQRECLGLPLKKHTLKNEINFQIFAKINEDIIEFSNT